jgi:putative NIF3 family GTP cyclohydrolase 1 type 2
LISKAYEKGADLFITGDISYFDGLLAKELGIALVDAGHWATEQPLAASIKEYLDSEINKECEVIKITESAIKTDPFTYF